MPRLLPLAVLSGPYEASQKWRPSWCSPSSLWSTGLSKYLLIRLSSAWLSPKEGGSESFLKDEKHSVSAASSTSVYTRGRFPLLNHFFLVAKCFSNYLNLLRTTANPLATFSSWNLFWVRGLPAGFVFLPLPISLPSTWGKNSYNHWCFIPCPAIQKKKPKNQPKQEPLQIIKKKKEGGGGGEEKKKQGERKEKEKEMCSPNFKSWKLPATIP